MVKNRLVEEKLAKIEALRHSQLTEADFEWFKNWLAKEKNFVVASIAKIVAQKELISLQDDLADTFDRFMQDPVRSDPGCTAKTEIAHTLQTLQYSRPGIFEKGISHFQLEPVYGGKEDTAAALRVNCALGLVQQNPPDVAFYLADLLADPVRDARIGAVRAIAFSGQAFGAPLLRYAARVLENDPGLMYEIFAGLLTIDAQRSTQFVGVYLAHPSTAVRESAALALGENGTNEALQYLSSAWETSLDPAEREIYLTALTLLRTDEAIDFLFSIIQHDPTARAEEALLAILTYLQDQSIFIRLKSVVENRNESRLLKILENRKM